MEREPQWPVRRNLLHNGSSGDTMRCLVRSEALRALKLIALLVVGGVAGCDVVRFPLRAAERCAAEAAAYDGSVAGAFDTTVGAIRRFEAAPIDQQRWPELPDARPAVLCYIDGDIAKALGGGDHAFDRAVVGVVDGEGEMVVAGFQNRLPVRAP